MSHRAGLDSASVVEAAAKLIDEAGIDQLSLGELAKRLGVRTPSLYNHVAGLPGLRRDLSLYCLREVLERVTRATIGKSHAEAIFAFAESYRAYAKETPGRFALTQPAPDPQDQELQAVSRQLIDISRAILAPYKLNEEDAIHAIRSLRSIVQGFSSLEITGGFAMPVDADKSFHWLINLYISGLSKLAGQHSPS